MHIFAVEWWKWQPTSAKVRINLLSFTFLYSKWKYITFFYSFCLSVSFAQAILLADCARISYFRFDVNAIILYAKQNTYTHTQKKNSIRITFAKLNQTHFDTPFDSIFCLLRVHVGSSSLLFSLFDKIII